MESCWICKAVFSTRKQLKQHVGKEHSILSVICPLCCHKEVHFKRVSDLKVHCSKSHPNEFKEFDDDAFNESNGFYLSVFPRDYSKLVAKADRLNSSVVKLRTLMIMWAKRLEGKCSKSKEELLDGWETGEDSYTLPKELEHVNLTETTELIIKQISLNASNPQIDLDQGLHKVRATLTSDLFDDKLAMRAIARRMAVLKNAAGHEQFNCDLAEACPATVALKLGIHRSLVKEVQIIKVEMGSSSKKIKLSSEVSELAILPTETATCTSKPATLPKETVTYISKPATLPTEAATHTPHQLNDPSKNIKLRSVSIPKRKEIISSMNSDTVTTQPPKTTELSYRATKLLRMGAMPLCPPGRRQWADDESVTLKEGNFTCKWPPKNWKSLSPDQKLLQLEILSIRILQERGVNTTNIQRSDILDQFNFLALPGTKPYSLPDASIEPTAHSRFYTYTSLRKIVNTKSTNSEKWLSMIECSSMLRDTSNDKLIRQCDRLPLRI